MKIVKIAARRSKITQDDIKRSMEETKTPIPPETPSDIEDDRIMNLQLEEVVRQEGDFLEKYYNIFRPMSLNKEKWEEWNQRSIEQSGFHNPEYSKQLLRIVEEVSLKSMRKAFPELKNQFIQDVVGGDLTHLNNFLSFFPNGEFDSEYEDIINQVKGIQKLGWYNVYTIKTASDLEVEAARTSYIDAKEYQDRLRSIGWDVYNQPKRRSHVIGIAPAGKDVGRVGFSENKANWEQHWQNQKEDLMGVSRDLEFIFVNPFKIPNNFNHMTLKLEETPEFVERNLFFNQLKENTMQALHILVDGIWKKPSLLDYNMIMFDDGTDKEYKQNDQLQVRIPNH